MITDKNIRKREDRVAKNDISIIFDIGKKIRGSLI